MRPASSVGCSESCGNTFSGNIIIIILNAKRNRDPLLAEVKLVQCLKQPKKLRNYKKCRKFGKNGYLIN